MSEIFKNNDGGANENGKWENMDARAQESIKRSREYHPMSEDTLKYKIRETESFKKTFNEDMYKLRVSERMKQEINNPLTWDNFKEEVNPVEGKYYVTRWVTERNYDRENHLDEDEGYVEWWKTASDSGSQEDNKRNYDQGHGIGPYSFEFDALEDAAIYAEKVADEAQNVFDSWESTSKEWYRFVIDNELAHETSDGLIIHDDEEKIGKFTKELKEKEYNETAVSMNADLSGNYEEIFLDVRDSNGAVVYESTMAINNYNNYIQ